MCHEFAHVRRHDYFWNLVCELLLLPVWFHPAAWLIKARVDESREFVCDEAAARCTTPVAYARGLVNVATAMASSAAAPRAVEVMALFGGTSLEERIARLLRAPARDRGPARAGALGIAPVALAGCLVFLPVAVQIPSPDGSGAALRGFAGRWEGRFRGRPFLTLTLAERGGALAGSVSRPRFLVDGGGELLEAEDQGWRDAASTVQVGPTELLVVSAARGRVGGQVGPSLTVPVGYTMKLTGDDAAEGQPTGAPPGRPRPKPWTLRRTVSGS